MAYARIVTKGRGTIIRNMWMNGKSAHDVNQIATVLESLICEELDILKVEVDYTNCNDSTTIEDYDPK